MSQPIEEIDADLYSRQIFAVGLETMKKLASSRVLICGCTALGIETAKNVILAGVKKVYIHDDTLLEIFDLSSNFFASAKDIGKRKSEVVANKLRELNPYCEFGIVSGDLVESKICEYDMVVLTNHTHSEITRISRITSSHGIKLIFANVRGVMCRLFNDFGKDFVVVDADDQAPQEGVIAHVSNQKECEITVIDEEPFLISDGATVEIKHVQGPNINGVHVVKRLGPYQFSIPVDTSNEPKYMRGGYAYEVKLPVTVNFDAYHTLENLPSTFFIGCQIDSESVGEIMRAQDAIIDEGITFRDVHPDANSYEALLDQFKSQVKVEISDDVLERIFISMFSELAPMTGFWGGIVAQEIMKGLSGKYMPVMQFVGYADIHHFPRAPVSELDLKPRGSRYDAQAMVIGWENNERIFNSKYFLVGAGAIGCEVIKNLGMMGLATGPDGHLWVTDMDTIEKSNLSRQFLFRESDIGKSKSECASHKVIEMNPELEGKITTMTDPVGSKTENIFTESFWENLDGICNALDNVEARLYTDSKAVLFGKPLMESGTLGTQGNTQIVVPFLTKSYGDTSDSPEAGIPLCTVHNFPHNIDHCIEWVRSEFQGTFTSTGEILSKFAKDRDTLFNVKPEERRQAFDDLKVVLENCVEHPICTFADCVNWAFLLFNEWFTAKMKNILHFYPADHKHPSGLPYWSGSKRCPIVINFDPSNELHVQFITSAAKLKAEVHNIEPTDDIDFNFEMPEWSAPASFVLADNEDDLKASGHVSKKDFKTLVERVAEIEAPSVNIVEFDKDFKLHMLFMHAASNIRAENYDIPSIELLECTKIAGKIIPAMVTTTALVSGFINCELYKLVEGRDDVEQYSCYWGNLANPLLIRSEPEPAQVFEAYNGEKISSWNSIIFEKVNPTLDEVMKFFPFEIFMVNYGKKILYMDFNASHKERLSKTIVELYECIMEEPIPEYLSYIDLVIAPAEDGIIVPLIRVPVK
eukprot:TRINITY_DN2611_c0_g1_i1.p1 TRINITY_DN2611_c0_g1~~TRINITY_DN2611_c0_g1_i1.p1  ORF type:complete len:989 (+),score=316.32 TRINITY_DN2611_c0_g1_i1:27-2969(+)